MLTAKAKREKTPEELTLETIGINITYAKGLSRRVDQLRQIERNYDRPGADVRIGCLVFSRGEAGEIMSLITKLRTAAEQELLSLDLRKLPESEMFKSASTILCDDEDDG